MNKGIVQVILSTTFLVIPLKGSTNRMGLEINDLERVYKQKYFINIATNIFFLQSSSGTSLRGFNHSMCTRITKRFASCNLRRGLKHTYFEYWMCGQAINANMICPPQFQQVGHGNMGMTTGRNAPVCTVCNSVWIQGYRMSPDAPTVEPYVQGW